MSLEQHSFQVIEPSTSPFPPSIQPSHHNPSMRASLSCCAASSVKTMACSTAAHNLNSLFARTHARMRRIIVCHGTDGKEGVGRRHSHWWRPSHRRVASLAPPCLTLVPRPRYRPTGRPCSRLSRSLPQKLAPAPMVLAPSSRFRKRCAGGREMFMQCRY